MLSNYSNINTVRYRAKQIYGDDVELKESTRNSKKYMLYNPNTKKWIHFGQASYQDYTVHKDKKRLELFRKRNARWATQPKYSAGFMSYHLLW